MNAPAVVEAAAARLSQAQAALSQALEDGANSVDARERVKRAAADLAGVQEQAGRAAEQAESERRQQIQSAADDEARSAAQQVAARIQALTAAPMPNVELPAGIAATVLEARHRAAVAADEAAAATARVRHLQDRVNHLTQRRAEIVARRQAGAENDASDGPALALIDADGSGLTELLSQAEAAAAGPARAASEAAAAVAQAEVLWRKAVEEATARALQDVVRSLENALVRAATELYPHRLSGVVSAWRPGRELAHIVGFGSPLGGKL